MGRYKKENLRRLFFSEASDFHFTSDSFLLGCSGLTRHKTYYATFKSLGFCHDNPVLSGASDCAKPLILLGEVDVAIVLMMQKGVIMWF